MQAQPTFTPVRKKTWTTRLTDFVSAPASPRPLAIFRIGICAVLLLQALFIGGALMDLYGPRGLVQWGIVQQMIVPDVPTIGAISEWLAPLGISPGLCVKGVFLLYVAALGSLLIGWHSRISAVVAWLTHFTMNMSGNASIYGVDMFANIALFYCIWFPVGHALSLDLSNGKVSGKPSADARLSLRVLQIHLCIVYLSSGIEKASGAQWLNGEAIWRSLIRPDLGQVDFTWLASVPVIAIILCWGTLFVEIGYALFVWIPKTRKLMAMATIGLHAGIGLFMGLWSFSALMITLTFAAFMVSGEPKATEAKEEEIPERMAA